MTRSEKVIILPRVRCFIIRLAVFLAAAWLFAMPAFAYADTTDESTPYSPFIQGPLGLNTVPSARMDKIGTLRLGGASLDPYTHGFIGMQLATPLYLGVRQTFESSNIFKEHDRLYPGLDVKLRVLKESKSRPDIAIGLQSAIGHKRMAGEYIAASKRYKDFDFTLGLGWGRYGSAGHFSNPLKALLSRFGKDRDLDGEEPHDPSDWFTGDDMGLFGGVEYFTPLKGLSLKFDYGADAYAAETAALAFDPPASWSAGFNYQPKPWVNLGLALQGNDKIMGRLSFNTNAATWRDRHTRLKTAVPMRRYRTDVAVPDQMILSAQRENILLKDTNATLYEATGRLALDPAFSTPYQLGRAAVHISNHAGPTVEKLTLRPQILGLEGPKVSMLRKYLEQTAHHSSSSDEIWASTEFDTKKETVFKRVERGYEDFLGLENYSLTLDNQISLAEEDSGVLYRSALLINKHATDFFALMDSGFGLRLNLDDNLLNIRNYRPFVSNPIRSDVDIFAQRTLSIDTLYGGFTHSFRTDLHTALLYGYLDEMYAGVGGEILYRPFKSRLALGAEAWKAYKRDPYTDLNLGLTGYSTTTAHLNAYYDVPYYDLTMKAKIGRYLADDIGGQMALQKTFKNGAQLEAFVSYSDQKDFDVLGGSTHGHHGLRLTLPLGGYKYTPSNANIKLRAEPFAKDTGQSIQSPLPLYELTQPFSYYHMAEHWPHITATLSDETATTPPDEIQAKKTALERAD